MSQKSKQFLSKFREFLPWFIAASAVLSANLAANAVDKTISALFSGDTVGFSWLEFVYILLFAALAIQFYRDRKKLFPPRTKLLSKPKAEERRHLVAFLSYLPWASEESNGIPKGLELGFNSLDEDIRIIEKMRTHDEELISMAKRWLERRHDFFKSRLESIDKSWPQRLLPLVRVLRMRHEFGSFSRDDLLRSLLPDSLYFYIKLL